MKRLTEKEERRIEDFAVLFVMTTFFVLWYFCK
jgi:hypothetical protein